MGLDMYFMKSKGKGKYDFDLDDEIFYFTTNLKIRKCILSNLEVCGDDSYLISEEQLWNIIDEITCMRFEKDFTVQDSYSILQFMGNIKEMLDLAKQNRLIYWDSP